MNERELLLSYRPWLRAIATRMQPLRAEEIAQEGWIAIWRAVQSHDAEFAPQDFWLKKNALDRMRSVLRDYQAQLRDWRQQVLVGDLTAIWEGEEALLEMDLAYHHGEIAQALHSLTPREREYVFLRFWHGYRKPEMIAHFGYEPNGLWRTARPKLAEALAHLAA